MSADLFDLRAKVTGEAHCALAAFARAHDIDKSEVVRDVLHAWAVRQIHGASMLGACLRAQGLTGAADGISGAARGIVAQSGESLRWDEAA
jgi:hypothetical protein